jgi:tetrahydrodipicolinate N-succinyltransferase
MGLLEGLRLNGLLLGLLVGLGVASIVGIGIVLGLGASVGSGVGLRVGLSVNCALVAGRKARFMLAPADIFANMFFGKAFFTLHQESEK